MLILASQSPRRSELLARAGFEFTVRVSGLEEERLQGEAPDAYVLRLAHDKAFSIEAGGEEWVLAADTTVVVGDEVLEKPVSLEDARRMLSLLSGRVHEVLTGVVLRLGNLSWGGVERTRVHFSTLSPAEIDWYAASGEPMDKAGAYAIQGLASRFIPRVEGCYFNVVGLPVALVYRLMREAGYSPARG
jgi:septum formation protein